MNLLTEDVLSVCLLVCSEPVLSRDVTLLFLATLTHLCGCQEPFSSGNTVSERLLASNQGTASIWMRLALLWCCLFLHQFIPPVFALVSDTDSCSVDIIA